MKLVKFYKTRANQVKTRQGVTLALDDSRNPNDVGRENGYKSFEILDGEVDFLDVTGFEIVDETPPPGVKPSTRFKQARA